MIANKKKNVDVFIFTNNFPFKPGENFLDLEITHLSKCFNTITLFPFKKSERLYKIPENASYTDDLINANPFLLLLAFIKMFFRGYFIKNYSC
ncbi:hypothetical protein [sulfur-oxidizing endosymbiont of Gigantopelta aegis]|uniref:hypothetical protein n=1 Tax=sulfur-oxidizing endosymbiont of Gigantopelta aegis TaxID=2794934 RepID=UPI0018DE818B|nr:hypothetical protein [sulfur-oxidizing endosymbiont of Gigantopelta aegis]